MQSVPDFSCLTWNIGPPQEAEDRRVLFHDYIRVLQTQDVWSFSLLFLQEKKNQYPVEPLVETFIEVIGGVLGYNDGHLNGTRVFYDRQVFEEVDLTDAETDICRDFLNDNIIGNRLTLVKLRFKSRCLTFFAISWHEFNTIAEGQHTHNLVTLVRKLGPCPCIIGGDFNTCLPLRQNAVLGQPTQYVFEPSHRMQVLRLEEQIDNVFIANQFCHRERTNNKKASLDFFVYIHAGSGSTTVLVRDSNEIPKNEIQEKSDAVPGFNMRGISASLFDHLPVRANVNITEPAPPPPIAIVVG